MRRCFGQQYEIRKELYSCLTRVFETNLSLQEVIIELLLPQFQKYAVEDKDEPPLALPLCIDGKPADDGPTKPMSAIKFLEPFPHLFSALSKCLLSHYKSRGNDDESEDEGKIPSEVGD
jgi:hypothetical protein